MLLDSNFSTRLRRNVYISYTLVFLSTVKPKFWSTVVERRSFGRRGYITPRPIRGDEAFDLRDTFDLIDLPDLHDFGEFAAEWIIVVGDIGGVSTVPNRNFLLQHLIWRPIDGRTEGVWRLRVMLTRRSARFFSSSSTSIASNGHCPYHFDRIRKPMVPVKRTTMAISNVHSFVP